MRRPGYLNKINYWFSGFGQVNREKNIRSIANSLLSEYLGILSWARNAPFSAATQQVNQWLNTKSSIFNINPYALMQELKIVEQINQQVVEQKSIEDSTIKEVSLLRSKILNAWNDLTRIPFYIGVDSGLRRDRRTIALARKVGLIYPYQGDFSYNDQTYMLRINDITKDGTRSFKLLNLCYRNLVRNWIVLRHKFQFKYNQLLQS